MELMLDPTAILQWLTSGLYVLLAVLVGYQWARRPQRRELAYAFMAVGSLGLASALGRVNGLVTSVALSDLAIGVFVFSGIAMFLFRNYFIRYPTWLIQGIWFVGIGVTVATVAAFPSPIASNTNPTLTGFQWAVLVVLFAFWSAAVLEPSISFWRAGRGFPGVRRARLRALSAAYLGIVAILVIALAVGDQATSPWVRFGIQLLSLPVIAFMYAAFAPPAWLRDLWRGPDEAEFARGMKDLILFAPDRATLSSRALDWSLRVFGGGAGLIVDADGTVLSNQALSEEAVTLIVALSQTSHLSQATPAKLVTLDKSIGGREAVLAQLPMEGGTGVLVIVAGPFTPFIGDDEVARLARYATLFSIALNRTRLIEALHAARREAELANQAKTEFLSRISHELRTPLTAIIGFGELLSESEIPERQKEWATTILRSGEHLLQLINEVLDITRIEAGHISMSLEPVKVTQVIGEAVKMLQPLADNHPVTLTVGADGEVVMADHQRLLQALVNLMANAIKYNYRGGRVSVEVTKPPDAGDTVRIAVEDTGPGLTEQQVGKLFIPFQRLGSASSNIQGTGLGLALTKSLVEAMGGTVGIKSEVGQGSTFWIDLAATDEEYQLAPDEDRPKQVEPADMKTILYVEDNLSNVHFIEEVLKRRSGITVIPVMQGSLAVELAKEHRPDLVLLDLHLVDTSGEEVLRSLHSEPLTKDIPVVMISADATKHQIETLMGLGAAAYLTKPIKIQELLSSIETYLGKPAKEHATSK
jgi:signal transduction histidine kinase/CheY-like chemotaxis protein